MFRNLTAIVFKIGTYCDLDCVYCFQQHDIKTINERFEIYKDTVKFLSHPLILLCAKFAKNSPAP